MTINPETYPHSVSSHVIGPTSRMIILTMYLLPRINVMLDFICMGSAELRGATKKLIIQNEKFCPQWDSNSTLTTEPTEN